MQTLDSWLNDMPQHFLGKKKIEILIGAFAKQLDEVKNVIGDLNSLTDLDTATGKNLDMVGTIIPLTRKEAGELAGIGVEDPVISDDRYRQFLRYKLLLNTCECTYYDLMEGISLLWDVSPVYYIEDPDFPATIILTMPFLTPGGKPVRLGEVPMVRPAGVQIDYEYRIKVVIETLCKWIFRTYNVPLCNQLVCGTYPRRGSVGEIMYIEMDADIIELQRIFALQKTGTIRVGGKLYDSTIGDIVTEGVEIEINSDFEIKEVKLAGQIVSGTNPIRAVNGVIIGSSVEADRTVTNASAFLPISGTRTSGGGEMGEAKVFSATNVAESSSNVHIAAAIAPKCGTKNMGSPETKVISEIVEEDPTVHVAAVSARKCGTGVCGNK